MIMNEPYLLNFTRRGQGPRLVLIHGVAGSSKIWDPIVNDLAIKYEVILVDLLGYGRSPKPHIEYTPEQHVLAIHETLVEAGIRTPYVLIGLSMGTLIALEYAKRWPNSVSSVLCIGLPYYENEADARKHLRQSIWARLALETPALGRVLINVVWRIGRHSRTIAGLFSRLYTPDMAQESMLNTFQAFRSTLMNCMVNNRPVPLLNATTNITQKYLHGAADRYSSPESVSAVLAGRENCQLSLLPGIAHNTVILAPKATLKWIFESLPTT
jgi:pimeloyl-ACP methyl ester carboxylesterase